MSEWKSQFEIGSDAAELQSFVLSGIREWESPERVARKQHLAFLLGMCSDIANDLDGRTPQGWPKGPQPWHHGYVSPEPSVEGVAEQLQ